MDFFCGPAVLHLDGEEFDVFAYIDSAREGNIEDWGGFVEIKVSDVIRFRAFGSDRISLQVPGSSARDIEVTYTEPWPTGPMRSDYIDLAIPFAAVRGPIVANLPANNRG